MTILITYDVSTGTKEGRRRLRRLAKTCEDYGQRVQFSVFECEVPDAVWVTLRNRLLAIYSDKEDSLRFYYVGQDDFVRAEHHGTKPRIEFDRPLIV